MMKYIIPALGFNLINLYCHEVDVTNMQKYKNRNPVYEDTDRKEKRKPGVKERTREKRQKRVHCEAI